MEVMIPREIRNNYDGYNSLLTLHNQIYEQSSQTITLNFVNTQWFEANLSAVLGAICSHFEEKGFTFQFVNLNQSLENILKRNQFLKYASITKSLSAGDTVITYRKFTPYADLEFIEYIRTELLSKPDFPRHSELLGKKINQSIFELFENARTHGHCKHIFTCGQYYPNMTKRLDMTIVDMGNTIKANVNEYLNQERSGSEAIEWAMQYGHTTKTGKVSGGLGLDIIWEFIKLNNGKIQIVSSDGYWEFYCGRINMKSFKNSFPGTIANIEFNLDDKDYYQLKEEISLDDIF